MRHGAQHVLDGVDRLQDHHFAETLILVPVTVASSSAVAVGVADRSHDLVGGGAVGRRAGRVPPGRTLPRPLAPTWNETALP